MKIEILNENKNRIICLKPVGVVSEDGGMPDLLKAQTGAKEIFCVHRLDRDVGGVMVYARNGKAAADLSQRIAAGNMQKEYLAVIHGCPETPTGELHDLLFHDRTRNKTYVVDRKRNGVKEASLSYEVLASENGFSLLKIQLHTGRSHQIRVQFASRKMPLAGDAKYGSPLRGAPIALWSHRLAFTGPDGKSIEEYSALPPADSFVKDYKALFEKAFGPAAKS